MPPRWMWCLDEELEDHFTKLKDRDHSGDRDSEDNFVIRNEYARGRGR